MSFFYELVSFSVLDWALLVPLSYRSQTHNCHHLLLEREADTPILLNFIFRYVNIVLLVLFIFLFIYSAFKILCNCYVLGTKGDASNMNARLYLVTKSVSYLLVFDLPLSCIYESESFAKSNGHFRYCWLLHSAFDNPFDCPFLPSLNLIPLVSVTLC